MNLERTAREGESPVSKRIIYNKVIAVRSTKIRSAEQMVNSNFKL